MSLPTTIPAAILETVLIRLAALFLAGAKGDAAAAREAALHSLTAYHPETETELRLAANILIFGFQALEALAQAAAPDMPLTRILRLRSGAVALSRESTKAERRLRDLRNARRQSDQADPPQATAPQPEPQPEPPQPSRRVENAVALIQDTAAIAETAKASNQTWTQRYEQRQRERRLAARSQRAEAHAALQSAHATIAQLAITGASSPANITPR